MTSWKSVGNWARAALVTAASVLAMAQAEAYTVSLTPAAQTVGLGSQVAVGVTVADLGGMGVGNYQFEIAFDGAVLGFDRAVDAFNLDFALGLEFSASVGSVLLGDTSLADPFSLLARQGDDVTLFTLFFNTLDVGTSALTLTVAALADAFGTEVSAPLINNGTVTVTGGGGGNPVSLPGSLALVLAAALSAAAAGRFGRAQR